MLAAVVRTLNHVTHDRAGWDRLAAGYARLGLRSWAVAGPCWGQTHGYWTRPYEPTGRTRTWLFR